MKKRGGAKKTIGYAPKVSLKTRVDYISPILSRPNAKGCDREIFSFAEKEVFPTDFPQKEREPIRKIRRNLQLRSSIIESQKGMAFGAWNPCRFGIFLKV